ncbi:20961_t:CDS:1, partial [Rhizophagus irregularis]
GLKDELSLMSTFAYTHIKFVTQVEEELPIDNTSTLAAAAYFNAFNRIMQSSA